VRERQQIRTRSTLEGYNEPHIQVRVEFDETALGSKWILCEACQPLGEKR
jgi:hypothetical protein